MIILRPHDHKVLIPIRRTDWDRQPKGIDQKWRVTARLSDDGIQVTRRTVAKYREDMKIPSTHQRRERD